MRELVGERIRKLRERKGLLPGDLASMLGVSVTTVYNWEQGRNLPACELLPQLAGLLNTSIDHLLRYGSKEQILQSITKYYFDLSLEEYDRATDLVKLSDEIDPDTMLDFRLLSMEMTHLIHQAMNLIERLDVFIHNYGLENQQLALRAHGQKIQLQMLFQGAYSVLEQLKKEVESNPSQVTYHNLIVGYLSTGHFAEALKVCYQSQVKYPSPELEVFVVECYWRIGDAEKAAKALRSILQNRNRYEAYVVIRAHELLYRILLQEKKVEQIVVLFQGSIEWLPGEYAKDGYDEKQAKRKLKARLRRLEIQTTTR